MSATRGSLFLRSSQAFDGTLHLSPHIAATDIIATFVVPTSGGCSQKREHDQIDSKRSWLFNPLNIVYQFCH
jgi:hypothetical protein